MLLVYRVLKLVGVATVTATAYQMACLYSCGSCLCLTALARLCRLHLHKKIDKVHMCAPDTNVLVTHMC
jgi:hypothetical protein